MCDVYLGGISDDVWRTTFKQEVSQDISIFDPMVDGYEEYNEFKKANQTARELFHMDLSDVIVFYLNGRWNGASTLLELGDSAAMNKQVVVCLDGDVRDKDKISRYCEYKGVFVVNSLEDLITAVEEYIAQIDLCKQNGFD